MFVTGSLAVSDRGYIVTIAYDARTGTLLWVKHYRPGSGAGSGGVGVAEALSPDGRSLAVTGAISSPDGTKSNYATVAYDAATGQVLWARRYQGPDWATPNAVAFSPDGAQVAVTGTSAGRIVTIAYQAATGTRLWLNRFSTGDYLPLLAYAPDGTRVYVTGSSRFTTPAPGHQFATAALDASNGTRLWSAHYPATPSGENYVTSLAVSPDGTSLYVTGSSQADIATLAYSTS